MWIYSQEKLLEDYYFQFLKYHSNILFICLFIHFYFSILTNNISFISTSAKGSPTEAIKLSSESKLFICLFLILLIYIYFILLNLIIGFMAIKRLCLRSNEESILILIEEFTTCIQIPEKVIKVTRRILRHHKKIFKEDIEKLCNFIVSSCEVICCLLSSAFRIEKNKKDAEILKQQSLLAEKAEPLALESKQ